MSADDAAREAIVSRWVADAGAVEENLVELCQAAVARQDSWDPDSSDVLHLLVAVHGPVRNVTYGPSDEEHEGSAFRGVLYGLALSVPFWAVVAVGWPWGAQWTG